MCKYISQPVVLSKPIIRSHLLRHLNLRSDQLFLVVFLVLALKFHLTSLSSTSIEVHDKKPRERRVRRCGVFLEVSSSQSWAQRTIC